MTQRQLAQLLGVDAQYISRWERGTTPSIASLVLLADALSVDVAWFYTDHAPLEDAA